MAAATEEGFALRARAQYADGDLEGTISTWEEMHAVLAAEGNRPGAARAAAMAALFLLMDTGLMAPVRGWLGRAEQLLPTGAGPEHAWVAAVRAYERVFCGDATSAAEHAREAVRLGERFGVVSAAMIGRVAAARLRIHGGDVDEGLRQLDELGTRLMSDDVDPLTSGIMYCELICAAQGLAMFDRAREWTEVMAHWCTGEAQGAVNGRCRVHRAELLRLSGPGDLAEAEALAALDALSPWLRRELGWPLVELGDIRLRRGDLAGAEEAFLEAHRRSWSPYPGLALLRLEQGDADQASALITEAIAHPWDVPSKEHPPVGNLRTAPLLAAQAEIGAAVRDVATVRRSAAALDALARQYPSLGLAAAAALARARHSTISGDSAAGVRDATLAAERWAELGAPYESSQARMLLGEVHARAGRHDQAGLEWRAARAGFRAFGARLWIERVDDMLAAGPGPGAAPRPASTEQAVFRAVGDTRVVQFGGREVTLRDLVGFRHLARLLAAPEHDVHVLDLVAAEHGTRPEGPGPADLSAEDTRGLPVLDEQAREAYRRRLVEVEQDIAEAQRDHDLARIELAERDRDFLIDELRRAVGLGGRLRTTGGSSERARASVTRSLRYAVARLGEHHPVLAEHLERGLRTGTWCSYRPDPTAPVVWTTGAEAH